MSIKHFSRLDPKLDKDEQEIEDNLEKSKPLSGKAKEKELKHLKTAAANFRKDKRITIRVHGNDLERIKILAAEEGLPYQTFITSMLHKLATGRLRDKNAR